MTEEIPQASTFIMKNENEGLSSALLRHGMTLEEEGMVTIIANVDQEAGIMEPKNIIMRSREEEMRGNARGGGGRRRAST